MKTAIDMSTELGVDTEHHEKWIHILNHISDYSFLKKQGKKVFRNSEKGTAWWESNALGIQHIYPAGQIRLASDPDLIQVAKNTITVMGRWIDFNASDSFFPAAVRVGYDPHIILGQLEKYVEHTYPNGFQLDNPHGIEYLSTVPNTINEMLLQSHEGVLSVFPVWPLEKPASFYHLRAYGAFLVSSELKNGEVQYVELASEKGRICKIQNPWENGKVAVLRNGVKTGIESGEFIEINTDIGERIRLSKIE
jgi:hypothetical protein